MGTLSVLLVLKPPTVNVQLYKLRHPAFIFRVLITSIVLVTWFHLYLQRMSFPDGFSNHSNADYICQLLFCYFLMFRKFSNCLLYTLFLCAT